jgi:hypothetical protein
VLHQCENKQKEITKSSNLKEYEKCAEQHKELRLLLSEKMKSEQKLHKLQKKMKRHLQYVASRATTEVKKGPATTTTCKQDIMSFFKLLSLIPIVQLLVHVVVHAVLVVIAVKTLSF